MKNYLIELIGTFFLVLVIGLAGNPIAIGCILVGLVYAGFPISGAHYNPAVTIAILLRKKIEGKDAGMYIVFQIIGALLAALSYKLMTETTFVLVPGEAYTSSIWAPLFTEVFFTFALVIVILNVATSKKSEGNSYFGLAIGFTVLAASFAGGPISGGAFNPAVGIGPIVIDVALNGGSVTNLWLYIVGPVIGGILGFVLYKVTNPDEFEALEDN
ncbi:MAG: aquaporin family protein [Bacteroidia bacterium]|nr:aquaporin family protein [Bacteroidia bacterium]